MRFVPKIINGVASTQEVVPMGEKILTWRDVLDCKKSTHAFIGDMAWAACDMRYKYFVWEGKVYECQDHVGEVYVFTGLLVKDIK